MKNKIPNIIIKIKSTLNEILDWESRQDKFKFNLKIDMKKVKKFIRWMGWRK